MSLTNEQLQQQLDQISSDNKDGVQTTSTDGVSVTLTDIKRRLEAYKEMQGLTPAGANFGLRFSKLRPPSGGGSP